jgi:hypothetical protein
MEVIGVLGISFIITFIYTGSKKCFEALDRAVQNVVGISLVFSSILLSLIIAFSIQTLWNRYDKIKLAFKEDAEKLELIYKLTKDQPDITNEIKNVLNILINNNINKDNVYNNIKNKIIDYSILTNNPKLLDYIENLGKNEAILEENNDFIIYIVLILSLIVLSAFWFLNAEKEVVQFIIDFGVISIIVFSLYLLIILNNPFSKNIIQIKKTMFENLLNKI